MNDKMTIRDAYDKLPDTADREWVIAKIQAMTGATRKAIVRKLNSLEDIGDSLADEAKEIHRNALDYLGQSEIDESILEEIEEDIDIPMEDSVNLALMKENSNLKRILKKLSIERGNKNLILDDISKDIIAMKPLPIVYKPDTSKVKKNATLVSLLSDFHIGSYEIIPGFNKFNYVVANSRIEMFVQKVLDWCYLHRNSYIVDEICLVCLGDMISGDIHDELRRTNEFSCPEQVRKASELLAKLIGSVAPHFKKVRVEFIVHDNHSRTTEKIQFADGTNSYNYLVGHLTKALTREVNGIEFNVYPEIQQVIKVQDRRYLIMHGNCVRGGGGALFPMTGITRKLWRESHLRMNMSEDMHFDKILMGHYHSPIDTPDISVAGCLVSSTGFDTSAARHTPACITSFFVCGKHEFDYTAFWLNEGETY